jgi:hypothetical protein
MLTKMAMAHLHTAILVRFPDISRLGFQPVIIQHTLKTLIKDPLLLVHDLAMRYHRAVIQLKTRRQTAKIQRHLIDKRFQRCKALTSAHTHMLNRRERKHAMTDLMSKRLAINRNAHAIHISPVHLHPFTRPPDLRKEDLLGLIQRTLPLQPTLQRP